MKRSVRVQALSPVLRKGAGAAALAMASVVAACAGLPASKDVMLTYETVPAGATLFEGGRSLGEAPVTRTYRHDGTSETLRTPEVTAVWPSGAKEAFYAILPAGADRVATIERPKAVPGLQADLDHAKKLVAQQNRDGQRSKEALARDLARNSARCKEQIAKNNSAANDC